MSEANVPVGDGDASGGSVFDQGAGDAAPATPVVPTAADAGGGALGLSGDSAAPFVLPDFAKDFGDAERSVIMNQKLGTVSAVVNSYMNLRKNMDGKDRIEIPSKDDADGWSALRGKLGRPDEASGYDLGEPPADGESAFTAQFRELAHARGMDQDQAAGVYADLSTYQAGVDSSAESIFLTQQAEATTALKSTWGSDYDQNMRDAKSAAVDLLGLDGTKIEALERIVGTHEMLDIFLKVKAVTGSHPNAGQGGAAAGGAITPAEATEELAAMRADKDIAARIQIKGSTERLRSQLLHQIIGGQASTSANIHTFKV